MTLKQSLLRSSEAITTDYYKSWILGIWFVVPFALTGFIFDTFFESNLHLAALCAFFVAVPTVLLKAINTLRDPINALRDPINALGRIRAAIVAALIASFRNPDSEVRLRAIEALARIGPEAVPALIDTLRNPDSNVRLRAIEALARIGPEARAAVPALIATLRNPDSEVRLKAAEALRKIDPDFTTHPIELSPRRR